MDPSRRRAGRKARRTREARGQQEPAGAAATAEVGNVSAANRGYRNNLNASSLVAGVPNNASALSPSLQQQQQRLPPPGQQALATEGNRGFSGGQRGHGAGGMDGASRLAEKMQRRREAQSKRQQVLSAREVLIQSRYAPHAMEVLQDMQMPSQLQSSQRTWSAAALQEMSNFNKDDLLAELITHARANFLRLDKELSDDHALATQRLHASVFAHANDFLLLFRDVEKSSGLVEALKASVQGTKAAISSISKFTYSSVGTASQAPYNSEASAATAYASNGQGGGGGSPSVFGRGTIGGCGAIGSDSNAMMSRVRPSLVSRRARVSDGGGGGLSAADGNVARAETAAAHSPSSAGVNRTAADGGAQRGSFAASGDGQSAPAVPGGGAGNAGFSASATGHLASAAGPSVSATHATTHTLNVSSVVRWRYTVGRDMNSTSESDSIVERGGGPMSGSSTNGNTDNNRRQPFSMAGGSATTGAASSTGSKELDEIQMFADVVKEETDQLLAERKPLDAAELLRGVSDEAVKRGCLPLLLDLEASLVQAVLRSLSFVPITPMYVETMHVPLIQLLMSFGRIKSGSSAYLHLQTLWLQGELRKLQSRVNPTQASLITVNFLVVAMRDILKRQHTLGMSLTDARRVLAAEETGGSQAGAAVAAAAVAAKNATAATTKANKRLTRTRDGATTTIPTTLKARAAGSGAGTDNDGITSADKMALVPPNSAALLWVRDNVEFFAREVLATHMLSYGTGTDGGDPSRIRRAVAMLTETIRALGVMASEGFAGCDTLVLRQLTPSLVVLQSEFTKLTEARMENSGRTMLEQLITNSLRMYESSGRLYTPSACGDVARKGNLRCQELLRSLKACLPCCSHSWLVQLLLCPAASSMFERGSSRLLESQQGVAVGGKRYAGASSSSTAAAAAAGADSPLLQLENYRFLRYANGCTSVHNVLIQSLVRFTTAMVGREWRHGGSGAGDGAGKAGGSGGGGGGGAGAAAAAASSITRTTTSAGVTVAQAKESKENTQELIESSRFLLSNALLTESYDVTMTRLLRSFLSTGLRERQALVNYLCSEAYMQKQQKLFPGLSPEAQQELASSQRPVLLADPSRSPGWVLDSMSALLGDVISVGVWSSYFSEGSAVSHLLEVAGLVYRPRHLENLRRAMPRITQGWLTATLVLAYHTGLAKGLLTNGFPRQEDDKGAAGGSPRTTSSTPVSPQLPRRTNMAGSPFLGNGGTGRGSVSNFGSPAPTAARQQSSFLGSISKRAGKTGGDNANGDFIYRVETFEHDALIADGGLVSVPAQVRRDSADGGVNPNNDTDAKRATDADAAAVLPDADVDEDRLLPFLMALLDRKFARVKGYSCHTMLLAAGCVAPRGLTLQGMTSSNADSATSRNADSATSRNAASASATAATPMPTVWSVRAVVPSYPEFPIGGNFDRNDELFLFHWCVQISLQLITVFQERLLTPSFVLNAKAAELNSSANSNTTSPPRQGRSDSASGSRSRRSARAVPFPVLGCVSPSEDSVLASLGAGGGNYVAAVGLLQFLVVRLLRDALCRPATWCALYDSKSVDGWRKDERCLRQQLFFFSIFLRLWSPLFSGGTAVPVSAGETSTESAVDLRRRGGSGGGAGGPDVKVSATNVDGLPSLAVLEWLATGGVLQPRVGALAGGGARAPQPVGRGTAIDVFFGGAATTAGGGDVDTGANTAGAGHGKKGWKSEGAGAGAEPGGGLFGSKASARRVILGTGSASHLPDTLLRVVQRFFEEDLGETRAVPSITSELMRKRVDRALTSINLLDFVGTRLDGDDDDDEESEEEEDSEDDGDNDGDPASASSRASSSTAGGNKKVTLNHVRNLLAVYTRPFQ